ncbi:MAG: SusC/RagA family TonB-linked outer membrane protein, partial [Prevotella sp.]
LLSGKPLSYEIKGKFVDIMASKPGQTKKNRNIFGVVRDEFGKVLPGATVKCFGASEPIEGSSTVTNANGQFQLAISNGARHIEVSYVGFETKKVTLTSATTYRISLQPNSIIIDELVAVGYGSTKAKDLTGSVARVSEKDIKNSPVTSNIASMLQGKASGVNVAVASASPTAMVSINVRGVSSLSGNGQPLWVIDGVPQYSTGLSNDISNTLYNLNLNDVQSVDILKDASATAIYGSRAANGVVIVTTKSGAEGLKPIIEFNTSYGTQTIDSNGLRTLTSDQYKEYTQKGIMLETYRNGKIGTHAKNYLDISKFNQLTTSQWDMSDLEGMFSENAFYDGNDDYWDLMTQNAAVQNYSVSVRGGVRKTSYYSSVNFTDQEGIVKGSNSRNFSGRLNFETMVSKKLKYGLMMDAVARKANMKDDMIATIINMRPDYPAYNEDGSINTISSTVKNPLIEYLNTNESSAKTINASAYLEYNFFKFLKFRTTLNAQYNNSQKRIFNRRYYDSSTNSGTESNYQRNTIVWDNVLTYYNTIGIHDIQAIAGHSVERMSYSFLSASGSDFPDDDIQTNLTSAAVKSSISSDKRASSLVSAFARVQYKLKNRYLLTSTFRTDGSSRFGKNNRWGFFPSVAAGWIISEEGFMSSLKNTISYLKLRVSHGVTGSQNVDYYASLGTVKSIVYKDEPGIRPYTMGNSLLQWERQKQTDIALDYGLFNDRIRGSFGWYRKYVDNLIQYNAIPLSSGFEQIRQNIGAISNTGLEFDIIADIIKQRDLKWEVNFNASHNTGKLEKLDGINTYYMPSSSSWYKLEVGQEIGQFWGYVDSGRLFENAEEAMANKYINPETGKQSVNIQGEGDIYVLDLDGDGKITSAGDRTYIGSCNPDVYGGFGSTLYWKGLRLNMSFTYSIGGKRYWYSERNTFAGTKYYNALDIVMDSYTVKGNGAKYPVVTQAISTNSVLTNRWLHDASYMRLSALNLSYKLPSDWFDNCVIKGVELSFQATNLFTITKYPGMDPQGNFSDANSSYVTIGYDNGAYPSAKTYNFGIKLTIN